jgi:AcrR family transcriptional regulator
LIFNWRCGTDSGDARGFVSRQVRAEGSGASNAARRVCGRLRVTVHQRQRHIAPAPPRSGRRLQRLRWLCTTHRAETRARLIEAARATFARQRIDATRIKEITDEADVGFGSFYNYFESKDAIIAAVVEEAVEAAGEAIDAAAGELDDPAEIVAVAHRSLIRRAAEEPEWGWLLVRLEISHDLAFAALRPYAARDLDRGIKAGRFHVDDANVALTATGGALLGMMRAVLRGRAAMVAVRAFHARRLARQPDLSPVPWRRGLRHRRPGGRRRAARLRPGRRSSRISTRPSPPCTRSASSARSR